MKADRQANARASSLKFRKRNGAHSESYLKKNVQIKLKLSELVSAELHRLDHFPSQSL